MDIKRIGVYVTIGMALSFIWTVSINAASSELVAKVNGEGIKKITLEAGINNFIENRKMLGSEVKQEEMENLRKAILEELISAELLYQESKKANLGNLDKEIEQQLDNIKNGFGSKEEFEKVLKDRGITLQDLKADVKKGVYIETFLEKNIYNKITLSEQEKKEEYEKAKDRLDTPEQVSASHILIKVAQDASEDDKNNARTKIEGLRQRAISGEDFAELAKQNSQDGSASNGGNLGYFKRGEMIKPFEDAAFGIEKNQISPVVETQFGYHIIKLLDRVPSHRLTYEEVEKDIEIFLLNKYKRQEVDKFVDALRGKAKIEVY
jgi:peptidyl-prolyl cis-trans isomerase C